MFFVLGMIFNFSYTRLCLVFLLEKFCFLLIWCVHFTWTKVYYLLLGKNYCDSIILPAQRTCPLLGPINMLVITQFENAVMCKLDIFHIAYTSPWKNAFNIKKNAKKIIH